MDTTANLSDQLRTLIDQSGLSRSEISRRSGLPVMTVSDFATGKTPALSLDRSAAIATAIGFPLAFRPAKKSRKKSGKTD